MGDQSQKEKQKKGSAKKKLSKGVRNVLAVPYEKFWPVINEEESQSLREKLQRVLSPLKRSVTKLPWKELKDLSKDERLEKRKALLQSTEHSETNLSQHVVFGINAVTRQLEKNNLCTILLDPKVDPPLLIKHIVMMSAQTNVPVLLVPSLSSTLLETINFSSIAIAFKNTIAENEKNAFHEICKNIEEMSSQFAVSKTFNQIYQTQESEEFISLGDKKMETDEVTNVSTLQKFTISTNVYLYRNSKNERSFIPRNSKYSAPMEEDFIAISNDDILDTSERVSKSRYHDCYKVSEKNKTEEDYYVPLKVKRMQGSGIRTKATKVKSKK